MKTIRTRAIWLAVTLAMAHAAHAADESTPPADAASAPESVPTIANADFCLYGSSPSTDAKYRSVGRVKLSKGTYGGVREELPAFIAEARAKGADAVTNYNGAQRFGFWPWRVVRPVLTGVAIKFDDGKKPDCAATGGSTLATVMSTNMEPARH